MPIPSQTDVPDEVCGIEIRSEFPDTVRSPDPVEMIEALVEHGQMNEAANEIERSTRLVTRWAQKYPEVREAYEKGSDNIGYEAEQTMVNMMRGKTPGDAGDPKARDVLNAAKRLASINHPVKDYAQRERRTIDRKQSDDQADKEAEDMDMDDLLDAYNEMTSDE